MSATVLAGRPVDAIVIGASSGGVEALSSLLACLPEHLVQPVFVVIHIPRQRPSLLVDVFSPISRRPVVEPEDKEPVTPGTVYLAPSDYHLMVERGAHIALSIEDLVNFSRPSIDVLFESAAGTYGDRLLGIVLTGASRDGADGLRKVFEAGGCTVVQDPDEAHARTMPDAAIAAGAAMAVLPIGEIGRLLATLDNTGFSTTGGRA